MRPDLKAILSHSAVYSVAEAINKAAAILLVPLYTRVFPQAEYGVLELTRATVALLASVSTLAVASAFQRYYSEAHSDPALMREGFRHAVSVAIVGTSSIGALVFLFSAPLAGLTLGDESKWRLMQLVTGVVFLEGLATLSMMAARMERQPVRYAVTSLVRFLVGTSAIVYLVLVRGLGIEAVLIGQMLGAAVAVAILGLRYGWLLPLSLAPVKRLLRFSVPLLPAGIAFLLMMLADRFMLRWLTSVEEVAVYGIAVKFGLVVAVGMVRPFRAAAGPVLYARHKEVNAPLFAAHITTYIWVGAIGISLVLTAFESEAVAIIAPPSYATAALIAPTLMVAQAMLGLRDMMSYGLAIREKTWVVSVLAVAGLMVNVVLNYVFIRIWGALGAGMATLVASVVTVLLLGVVGRRWYPLPIEWGRLSLSGAVFAVVGVGLYLAGGGGLAWIIKPLLVISVPFWLWLVGFYKPAEIDALRNLPRNISQRVRTIW